MKFIRTLVVSLSALLVLSTGPAAAGSFSIYVDFSGPTQEGSAVIGSLSDVWNGIAGNSGTGIALVNSAGTLTSKTLDFTSLAGYSPGPVPGRFPAANDDLADGYLVTHGADTVTLHGFDPNSAFDIYLYSQRDNGNARTSFSVTGAGSQVTTAGSLPGAFVFGQNYLLFSGNATAGGDIVIDYAVELNEGIFNGFQLVAQGNAAAVPEPGSLMLVGVGVMGLIGTLAKKASRTTTRVRTSTAASAGDVQ